MVLFHAELKYRLLDVSRKPLFMENSNVPNRMPSPSVAKIAVRNWWLPGLGSNQGFQLQRLTCCHYTTGQFAGLRETPRVSILLLPLYGVK